MLKNNVYLSATWENNEMAANNSHYEICTLSSLSDLEESDSDQDIRLTTAEENIQGNKIHKVNFTLIHC